MDYMHIVTQMASIFGIVLVGFFASKRGLWAAELDRKLTTFVINISMPALILSSAMGKDLAFERHEILTLMLVAVLNYAILLGAAAIVPRLWKVNTSRQGLLRFMIAFGNVSFIGYPVVDAVFGPKAVFCASVLNVPSNVLMFTIGISFITGGKAAAAFRPKMLLSPCVVASLLAMVLAIAKIQTPTPVADWFHLLGDMTIPCALLIIGSSMSHIPPRDMWGNRFVYATAALRLGLMPVLVLICFRLIGIDPFVTGVAVVLSGMPVATNGIMFCLQYGKDERVMTQGLFVTTLLSVATIPVLAMFL